MTSQVDLLEQRLLESGREELELETRIRDLQRIAREEGLAGRFEASDAAWELRQQLRAELATLQVEIMQTERTLYGLRRNNRR